MRKTGVRAGLVHRLEGSRQDDPSLSLTGASQKDVSGSRIGRGADQSYRAGTASIENKASS
jgi:hypothetical protein